jgi:hypothetical protein
MTWLETEDIAAQLRTEAKRGSLNNPLLLNAAEAIEWLRERLREAEGEIAYLEEFEP